MSDPDQRSLDAALVDLAPALQTKKAEFRVIHREVAKHSQGFEFGRLEYTCRQASGTPLTEWHIIIKASDKKRMFILASSASGMWEKYRPGFETFFQSVKLIND